MILEGCEAELGARSNLSREAFQGAMLSLGLAFHIPVLRSLDPRETARLLVFAGNQAARRHELAVSPRPGRRPRSVERQRMWILLGLPGIGAHRARALLTRFGSVQAVMTAGEGELAATSGIGAVTARRLRALIAPPTGSGPAPEVATTEARESRGCESRR